MLVRSALLLLLMVWGSGIAHAQEPETRAEALAAAREAKSQRLAPYEMSGLEKALLRLENGRILERLLNPPVGLYPKLGSITPGSGFSMGPGYRKPGLFGEHADFNTFAAISFTGYWMVDARLLFPRLAGETLFADLHAQRYDFPSEAFFGIGPESAREDGVAYGLRSSAFGGGGGVRPARWFTVSGSVDYLTPAIRPARDEATITDRFVTGEVPGLIDQPDFVRYQVAADLNYREPRGNPRRGGRYLVTYQKFDERDLNRYSFDRVEVDLQQYVPLLKDRRVLALRSFVSMSDGDEVPFYYQRTLGGPDDLRGFRRYRFRDRNQILFQAEYRWEIFTAVDGAIFYDAGKVAPHREDLDVKNLESDYGIGFRFGTINGVFLRIEGAFGSSGGKHFVFRYGNVF